jgi:hypothetical protein
LTYIYVFDGEGAISTSHQAGWSPGNNLKLPKLLSSYQLFVLTEHKRAYVFSKARVTLFRYDTLHSDLVVLGGLVVSVLATGSKVSGLRPDRGQWIFKGDKDPQYAFLRRERQAACLMS